MNNQQQVQVRITREDHLRCACGSEGFIPIHFVVRVKPLIGQPAMDIPNPALPPQRYICANCGAITSPDTKTVGEIEKMQSGSIIMPNLGRIDNEEQSDVSEGDEEQPKTDEVDNMASSEQPDEPK